MHLQVTLPEEIFNPRESWMEETTEEHLFPTLKKRYSIILSRTDHAVHLTWNKVLPGIPHPSSRRLQPK